MSELFDLTFLLDVDNTLLDNDAAKDDIDRRIRELLTPEQHKLFWQLYEEARIKTQVVDFPLTVSWFAERTNKTDIAGLLLEVLDTYHFEDRLFPGVFDVIKHLKEFGPAAIVSVGDHVFQPHKIAEAGLAEAVAGNVLVFEHKEQSIAQVMERFPSKRYVMVDDKRRILAALKAAHPDLFSTVHVLQGHYAHADENLRPDPDIEVNALAELLNLRGPDFLG
jgi:phosphoglycolate phosphatase-like HAD superfamily hydrolase